MVDERDHGKCLGNCLWRGDDLFAFKNPLLRAPAGTIWVMSKRCKGLLFRRLHASNAAVCNDRLCTWAGTGGCLWRHKSRCVLHAYTAHHTLSVQSTDWGAIVQVTGLGSTNMRKACPARHDRPGAQHVAQHISIALVPRLRSLS